MLIAFEGVDFAGKSTLCSNLASMLEVDVYHTPSGEYAKKREQIDAFANTLEHYRFYVEAVKAASKELVELVQCGRPVLLDRYVATTMAYHMAHGLECNLEDFGEILFPDVTVYVTVDPDVQRSRLSRGMSTCDVRDWPFQDAVRRSYEKILPSLGRVVRIDTTHKTPEECAIIVAHSLPLVLR